MRLCDKSNGRICTEEEEDVSIIKGRERLTNSPVTFQTRSYRT